MIKQTPTYFNLSGGLNTESGPINMPATDAVDILNVKINIDGSIQRRRGVDFFGEKTSGGFYYTSTENFTTLAGTGDLIEPTPAVARIHSFDEDGFDYDFVVVHFGTKLFIYKYTEIQTLQDIDVPFQTIDMSAYMNTEKAPFVKTQFLLDKTKLFLINKYMHFGFVSYDVDTYGFKFVPLDINVRDAQLNVASEIDSMVNHNSKYYQCIKSHKATLDTTPGVGTYWSDFWAFKGAAASGGANWAPADTTTTTTPQTEVSVETFGNYPVTYNTWPKQIANLTYKSNVIRYIEDFLQHDEDEAYVKPRIGCGTFSAGRLWLSGIDLAPNTILISQSITRDENYSNFYQYADPYSKTDSAPADNDGMMLSIVGANKILAIAPFKAGVVVFASNGVWYIASGATGFRATDYVVNKISDNGLVGSHAYVVVEDHIFYCSLGDIFAITPKTDDLGNPNVVSIATKIMTFYNSIPLINKEAIQCLYNYTTKKVSFFCNFVSTEWMQFYNRKQQPVHFRDTLMFDLRMKCWYKYSMAFDEDGFKPAIADAFLLPRYAADVNPVVANNDDAVVTELDDIVIASITTTPQTALLNGCLFSKIHPDGTVSIAFGTFEGEALRDFAKNVDEVESYESYVQTSHQLYGDILHSKFAPYIETLFKRVETGELDEDGNDINEGGCYLRVAWEWANSPTYVKFGVPQQAYFPTRMTYSPIDGAMPGNDLVLTKHRIRGMGKTFQLKFSNDGDKDFYLAGWQLLLLVQQRV